MRRILIVIIVFMSITVPASNFRAEGREVLLREDFVDLENWEPLHFPKITEHSEYSIEKEGGNSHLKAISDASASAIVMKYEFNVFQFSRIRWRWKISNVFSKGDASKKSGDDYPLRVYVIFNYDPDNAAFGKKIKFELAKKIYGEYPFDSCLSYIWANRQHDERIVSNVFASESKLIILQEGNTNAGVWLDQEINIIEDYHRAFGKDPPAVGRLAIMSDSDNTKESAVSFIDYIEVYR
ncbi:MAG: DUF3047 domain-containing protein [Nitrospiraceae bacterium]|nr:MAG: DUF3047 domain-containing protein [Nitrospiraceae bacterium]